MTGYLTPVFGEDLAPIANLVVGFLIIVLAVFVCLWLWRKVSGGSFSVGARARRARLGVLDSAPVDSRRRLMLVRRDNVGHLILTGGPSDVVVETNIDLSQSQEEHPVQPAAIAAEPAGAKPAAVKAARIEEQAPKPAEPAPKAAEPASKAVEPAPRPVEPEQRPKTPAEAPAPAAVSRPKDPVPTELTAPPVVAAATAVAAASQIDTTVSAEAPAAIETPMLAGETESGSPDKRGDPPLETAIAPADEVAPAVETATADDGSTHELDPELLQELQATLNSKPDATGAEAATDVSLEREMSKLLNNLSADRSG